MVQRNCLVCKKVFSAKESDIKRGYGKLCSRSCSAAYKHKIHSQEGSNNPNWKNGISKNNYHYKLLQKARYPERIKARTQAYDAARRGKISTKPCEVCNNPEAQIHHEDYGKPLEINWLCREHHRERH